MPVDRFKLHGKYQSPQFRYGQEVTCEVRGDMIITGITDAPIPWPVGRKPKHGGPAILIVYKGLARAVRRESSQAVAHHWGVSIVTVWTWRKALGVDANNEGTRKIRAAHYQAGTGDRVNEGARRALSDAKRDAPRREKIAASKRGKKRSKALSEALRQANIGKRLSAAHRAKQSETHRKRGTRPPWINPSWTAEEDQLLLDGELTPAEIAERTGRTLAAVYLRRKKLGLRDLRRRTVPATAARSRRR